MIFGTFDHLHPGHLDFFRQAKAFGDYLIVVVARDQNVLKIKGQKPRFNENARLKAVKKIEIVNQAILGYKSNRLKIIKELRPDVVCLGYDQRAEIADLKAKFEEFNFHPQIHRLQPFQPDKFKSSLIKKGIKKQES